jgi:hypothetical protein
MRVVRELRDLVAALDRRLPQRHRVGEDSIAKAAMALRNEAVSRVEELEREASAEANRV